MAKKRLDNILADRKLVESRSKARAVILAGDVFVDGNKVDKAGAMVDPLSDITIKRKSHNYVSRGGVKLARALAEFQIDPARKVCLDIGSSTGGFTDCLLQNGAVKVWALDTGVNQLHYKLRTDPRVVCLEKTNARKIDLELITDPIDILVADVSFISLRLVVPPLLSTLRETADLALLVKPQFEAGRDKVGKGGVVRDPVIHEEVLVELRTFFQKLGLHCFRTCRSPILGPKGNAEFFIHMNRRK